MLLLWGVRQTAANVGEFSPKQGAADAKGKMKTRSKHLNGIAVGSALMLVLTIAGQAGPHPDLMNSIWRIRSDAEKSTKTERSELKTSQCPVVNRSWLHTRNIMAGQSIVAVPDTSVRLVRSPESYPKNK